jgi:hypothetical protein
MCINFIIYFVSAMEKNNNNNNNNNEILKKECENKFIG